MNLIIYPNEKGGINILTPSRNTKLSIGEIAIKDVPSGIPYKILNSEQIPTDRVFRDAWEYDFSSPDGYGIGHEQWFKNNKDFYRDD